VRFHGIGRLVTNDTAFYADRNLTRGLASELAAELAGKPHELTIMAHLSELLKQVRVDYDISAETISRKVLGASRDRLVEQLGKNGFSLGEIIGADRKLFATENPRMVFVDFQITYQCPDLTNTGRAPATLTVRGDGTFDAEAQAFREHRTLSETIRFRGEDDANQEVQNTFLHAEGLLIGQKEVRNIVRYVIRE